MRILLLIGCLMACRPGGQDVQSEGATAVWLEGFGYEWGFFNHRLSHLELGVDETGGWASVVGGTSTTAVAPELPAGCEPSECSELPFVDVVDVSLNWGRVVRADARFGGARAVLTADADGETVTVSAQPARPSEGAVSAVIRGVKLSTSHPLDGGPSCYDPANGWLPTQLEIAIGAPSVSGRTVSADVSASFAAGNTLEDFRACIDAVQDEARVAVEVDVLFVVGGGAAAEVDVQGEAVFSYGDGPANPDVQEPPSPQAIDLGLTDPLLGWRSMAWAFHVDDPTGRGAYLRRLEARSSLDSATGLATNYSPATQITGFDYTFSGVVAGHEVGGEIERGTVAARLDVVLEDDGTPKVHPMTPSW